MPIPRPIRVLLWILLAIILAGAIAFVIVIAYPAPLERWLQDRLVLALREHYNANVTLDNVHVTVSPVIYASADNLVVPNPGDPSLPPLITVKHLTLWAGLLGLWRTPVHVSDLKLEGLEIRVSPKRQADRNPASSTPTERGARETAIQRPPGNHGAVTKAKTQPNAAGDYPVGHTHLADFVIDKLQADGAKLYILRKDPSREPLLFDLRKLQLRSAGVGQPMKFTAELTNPTPPGIIATTGRFGPWNFDDPGATALGGHYTFQNADLSVFNGISGTLSSVGDYSGVLHNIVVDGTTDTPDFKLDSGGETVHLTTSFHAIVDGTNGNTYLQSVKAHFLQSDVITNGEVAGKTGQKGKTINLDVDIEHARVQDVLAMAAKSQPALTGRLGLKAQLELPPGKEPVLQRMQLNGRFHVSDGQFSNETIKKVVVEMSRRGQGRPNDQTITEVASDLAGNFRLKDRTLTFAGLQFMVPGAAAQFNGAYQLPGETLNFAGDVRLHATLSEAVGGSKGWLLFPLDAIFMKHGAGTWVPITITGTREHPQVHVQWKKLFGSGS